MRERYLNHLDPEKRRIWILVGLRIGTPFHLLRRTNRCSAGDVDVLSNFREVAPGMPYAHPTVEHFTPLFITLGAASMADAAPETLIDGYFMGLSKRSILVA